jgi:hypothetical protein
MGGQSAGKPNAPSSVLASFSALAPRSVSLCDPPGVNAPKAASPYWRPNAGAGSNPGPANPWPFRVLNPLPGAPPAMLVFRLGVNAVGAAPPSGGSGVPSADANPQPRVEGRPACVPGVFAVNPCSRAFNFSIISSVSSPGVNPPVDDAAPAEPATDGALSDSCGVANGTTPVTVIV